MDNIHLDEHRDGYRSCCGRTAGGSSKYTSCTPTIPGWRPACCFKSRKIVTSRLRERIRFALKHNLKIRRSFKDSWRASHTSPKPPSPSFLSSVHFVLGTICSTAGRQPSTASPSAETWRNALAESRGADSDAALASPTSQTSIDS